MKGDDEEDVAVSQAAGAGGGPEARVAVVNAASGTVLTGDDAPTKAELGTWLEEHPG